jgi:membrane-associated phospholipid phosphatase
LVHNRKNVPRLRSSEGFLIAYFLYVAVAGTLMKIGVKPWLMLLAVVVAIAILARGKSILRDVAPLAYTLAAYREMNWFTPATHEHRLERAWIVWDRWLLGDFHLRAAIEYAGAMFPLYFELCYALVYAVAPVSIALLFIYRRRGHIDRFWMVYLAGTLGAYALFPFFPSEPPRTVFPTEDLPQVMTLVRRFNLWILGGFSIHSSVFPSAHVSSTLSAAWGLLYAIPERRGIGLAMACYGFSVAIATIYGRYHFATDALAGIVISFAALFVARTGTTIRRY